MERDGVAKLRSELAAIIEEHAFAQELAAHEIPVVAPWQSPEGNTLFHHEGFLLALFPRRGGRVHAAMDDGRGPGAGRGDAPTTLYVRRSATCRRAAGGWWTWIWRSSSTAYTTTC